MKAVVQQIGARMDYAVPRALHAEGVLECLVTDLHFEKPPKVNRLARYSSELPSALISKDNIAGLVYRAVLARSERSAWPHIRAAEAIAARTFEAVNRTAADIVYGYDTAMLPALDAIRSTGAAIVLEQCIAPRAQFIGAMERMRNKIESLDLSLDLSDLDNEIAVARIFSAIEQAEWPLVDRIYCPSNFVASALSDLGVADDNIRVIPYGISLDRANSCERTEPSGKPKVKFCGRFSWRKGALEFGLLATALRQEAEFEALGIVGVPEKVADKIAPDVALTGHLDRQAFLKSLAKADLMVLPSYSEGSATVIYEAMTLGVPCVVSAQAGSVITHGKDGMIVQAGDQDGLISAVTTLLNDSSLRREMGEQAQITAQSFTRESYGARVHDAMQSDLAAHRDGNGTA